MKSRLLLLFLCVGTVVKAQDKKALEGKVISGNTAVAGVFVINKRTGTETKTETNGIFNLYARPGDRIAVYSENIAVREFVLSERSFSEHPYLLEVEQTANELDEVVVQGKSLDAEAMGLVQEGQKQYSVAENRKRANRIFRANQGLSISGDAIANRINGKSRIIKQNVNTAEKIQGANNLKALYTPQEITDNFGIPANYVEGFIFYAAEDPDCLKALKALKANNRKKVKPHLQNLASEYIKIIEDEK